MLSAAPAFIDVGSARSFRAAAVAYASVIWCSGGVAGRVPWTRRSGAVCRELAEARHGLAGVGQRGVTYGAGRGGGRRPGRRRLREPGFCPRNGSVALGDRGRFVPRTGTCPCRGASLCWPRRGRPTVEEVLPHSPSSGGYAARCAAGGGWGAGSTPADSVRTTVASVASVAGRRSGRTPPGLHFLMVSSGSAPLLRWCSLRMCSILSNSLSPILLMRCMAMKVPSS